MAAKVLTVSDGVVHGTREDRSGAALEARLADEVATMEERWGDLLRADPAHSPNLALGGDGFTPAAEPRVSPPWRA